MRSELVWIAIAAAVGCTGAHSTAPPAAPRTERPPPAAAPAEPSEPTGMPAGYVEVKAERVMVFPDEGAALLLVDEKDNLVIPVWIGGTEALSIEGRLHGVPPVRPLTHDLLDHVMAKLHATLVKVQVDEMRRGADGGVFIGSIFVRANGRVMAIDARPSDAIALAIGNHVPIYCARRVLEETGWKWDEVQRQLAKQSATGTES